jgi:hypothetical protein
MSTGPYFERLGEAYAVIGGIPDQQITLDIEQVSIAPDMTSIGVSGGRYLEPSNWDGLVLTPDIWLSLCPAYIDIVWPLVENRETYGIEAFWQIEGRFTSRFELAMAHLFNVSPEDAEDLFGMRGDDEMDDRSDKQVFLDRITAFLQDNGQEVTIGSGHVDQHEMLEHGIAPVESAPAVQTGFAATALESDTPGAETLETEASATAVSPVVHEQSVEQKEGN